LFIGKSNKQIEIQTVVKTNIVEKPVEKVVEKIVEKPVKEFVDKYITNIVEKIVEAEIPTPYKNSFRILNRFFNSEWLEQKNGFKCPHFESLSVTVHISEPLKAIISAEDIKTKLELELRKAGVKIESNPSAYLTARLEGFELDNKSQYVYKYSLDLETMVFLYDFSNEIANRSICSIWNDSNFGIAGKSVINKTFLNNKFAEMSDELINKLLEAKSIHNNLNEKK
jgi:hypothetical protein